MEYKNLVKKLSLPTDFKAPTELKFDDLRARPLKRADLAADMEGVNSSMQIIRETRGGSWPSEPVTEDFDLLDLAWHEREFREGSSFAYVVYNNAGTYIGCFYLYPMGARTPLDNETKNYDIDASWWVTAQAYDQGYYEKVYSALKLWLSDFPVNNVYYSNKKIPS